jgi:hypothetical protein
MPDRAKSLIEQVTDEKSFNRFLSALREDCETTEHDCERRYEACLEGEHFQSKSTKHFLRSVEDWATRGDFADGEHYGEPILRRVATMLYVGRHLLHEDMPPRH